jgi:hypothetical protein
VPVGVVDPGAAQLPGRSDAEIGKQKAATQTLLDQGAKFDQNTFATLTSV